ncbi:MAG: hypothetical protein WC911_09575 [Thermoleophilia bacterium]
MDEEEIASCTVVDDEVAAEHVGAKEVNGITRNRIGYTIIRATLERANALDLHWDVNG